MSNKPLPFLESSIIVVAHPDDEILWFSSIIDKVDSIVCCFEHCADAPALGAGRNKALSEYPLSNIVSLALDEPVSFNKANWEHPAEVPEGLEIANNKDTADRYRRSYTDVETRLSKILANARNVFTHNPWGEYGHEDHVQVFRAVRALQNRLGFDLWYSNYAGNRSVKLMLSQISGFSSDYITLPTNLALAADIQMLYTKHGCWTWYDDYRWFREESFMKVTDAASAKKPYGHFFPINFIKTDVAEYNEQQQPDGLPKTVKRFVSSVLRRIASGFFDRT